MLAGPLSLRLRAASSRNETSSCPGYSRSASDHEPFAATTVVTACATAQRCARRFGSCGNHPRRLDAAERGEAGELVVLGKSLRLDDDSNTRLAAAVPADLSLGHTVFAFREVRPPKERRTRVQFLSWSARVHERPL
jgi:hypothetical protein